MQCVFSIYHQADACLCAKNVEILQTELLSHIKLLKETVKSKTAVPTAKVFVSIELITFNSCICVNQDVISLS